MRFRLGPSLGKRRRQIELPVKCGKAAPFPIAIGSKLARRLRARLPKSERRNSITSNGPLLFAFAFQFQLPLPYLFGAAPLARLSPATRPEPKDERSPGQQVRPSLQIRLLAEGDEEEEGEVGTASGRRGE